MSEQLLKFIGQHFKVDPAKLAAVKKSAAASKNSIASALEQSELIPKGDLLKALSNFYKVPMVKLAGRDIPENILAQIPRDIATNFSMIPIDKAGNNLIVAMANPADLAALDTLRFKVGYIPKKVVALSSDVDEALSRFYGYAKGKGISSKLDSNVKIGDRGGLAGLAQSDAPAIKLVDNILAHCLKVGASDIHIETYEDFVRIRMRIDGGLQEINRPNLSLKKALIARIKIMAKMDIAENRLPQDGAINVTIDNKPVDFRVNTLPTVHGEKVVLRILDKSALKVDMTELGFDDQQLKDFKQNIERPFGMVLVTGPTGSGKTTTLYSALKELNRQDSNIMTAEDPVEFAISGINQVGMKPKIGLNFASALRSFLRQDPDTIMVGEIRDTETAEIAIKAALTGHLVLSTLHTNNAIDTISRLINMGVAGYNLVAALNCIVAQRLVRKICKDCKVPDTSITPTQLEQLGIHKDYVSKIQVMRGKGCETCNFTGGKGRGGVHEILIINEPIKKAIIENVSSIEMKKIAMQNGMRTLRQSAINKMVQGIISYKEVLNTTDG